MVFTSFSDCPIGGALRRHQCAVEYSQCLLAQAAWDHDGDDGSRGGCG
jgi:hypothetical protein